jgi:hypothetical protein
MNFREARAYLSWIADPAQTGTAGSLSAVWKGQAYGCVRDLRNQEQAHG